MDGQPDLAKKLLRCVGRPEKRFGEDALRMLRALRFSAQLGFEIEKETMDAVSECASLCRKLSAERVRDEVEKTLLSPRPQTVGEMARLGLLQPYISEENRDCSLLERIPAERTVRWAALCRIYPELDLVAMRLDKKTARDAMTVAALECPQDRLGWKKMISVQGKERGLLAGKLFCNEKAVEEILASGECLILQELAVAGADLAPLQGPEVGQTLHRLLQHVLEHPEDNQKEILLRLI
jgi:tRNA nucleotidyltransferase (CCA-adding enzyme)